MKVIFKDLKHGRIKLIAENLDDIWHLYNIIDVGDLVHAVSFRTVENGKNDKIRSKKTEKKRMKLTIRVSEIKFHDFSDRLRIHGKIEEGPQDLGSYHTFNVISNNMDPITIIKENWEDHHLDRINEAVKLRNQSLLTLVSLDEDNATIAILRQSGVQNVAEIDSKRSGKMYETAYNQNQYFSEILSVIENNIQNTSILIFIGPGFSKENLVKYMKEKHSEIMNKIIVHNTSSAGINGIQEAIKTGVIKQITIENRVDLETNLIKKLFEEIRKNGLATYGIDEVKKAVSNGAVERVLIIDKIIRTEVGEQILKMAKENRSEFTIINTINEAGKELEGIGGIGALLRYKI
jgi:protein pelota